MDMWSKMLSPWMSIRMPASGDVTMNYHPWTNWGWANQDAGDPEIEREIFTKVALPGKQLGKLTDALLALIDLVEQTNPDLPAEDSEQTAAIRDFKQLARRVADTKSDLLRGAEHDAERALQRLKSLDPEAYLRVLDAQRPHSE